VSYTNDGQRLGTYDTVREWVMRNDRYKVAVQDYLTKYPEREGTSNAGRFNHLAQCLLHIVQLNALEDLDADVQIALAVLFNANEVLNALVLLLISEF
jgi:peroxin-5